jgi:prepilin-type N-terminal cleavage/methylation domain-containing protein
MLKSNNQLFRFKPMFRIGLNNLFWLKKDALNIAYYTKKLFFQKKPTQQLAFGFTLAELLIALSVISVVSVFLIPKIITGTQATQYKALGKDAAKTIGCAFKLYQAEHTVSATTSATDLFQYINGALPKTSGLVDDNIGYGALNCAVYTCIQAQNGGVFWADTYATFQGTSNLNAIYVSFDPDGVYGGSTTGNSKALGFLIYYNGRISTYASALPGTLLYGASFGAEPDPPWFNWN